jgi:hypothetical protein
MLIGLGDGAKGRSRGEKGCDGAAYCASVATREKRRAKALRELTAAHAAGTLGGLGDLGGLEAGAWLPARADIEAEEEAFDGRLNAWMVDYQAGANRLPAAIVQQVDDFIARWRDLHASFFIISKTRADAVIALEAEFNRLKAQLAAAGVASTVAPATVSVDGKEVPADEIPPGSSTLDRVESIAKWAGLAVAGVVAFKVVSDLGLITKIGGLFKGRSSAGGVRRFGSARLE